MTNRFSGFVVALALLAPAAGNAIPIEIGGSDNLSFLLEGVAINGVSQIIDLDPGATTRASFHIVDANIPDPFFVRDVQILSMGLSLTITVNGVDILTPFTLRSVYDPDCELFLCGQPTYQISLAPEANPLFFDFGDFGVEVALLGIVPNLALRQENNVWTGLGFLQGNVTLRETVQVSEPGTLTLFGLGLLGMGLARRKSA